MARRSWSEQWAELPSWQQRSMGYLGLGPDGPRPPSLRQRRVSAAFAVLWAVLAALSAAEGRWGFVALQTALCLMFLLGTRTRTPLASRR